MLSQNVATVQDALLIQKLQELLDGKSATAREAALLALVSLMDAAGLQAEPFVEPLLPVILTLAGDKVNCRASFFMKLTRSWLPYCGLPMIALVNVILSWIMRLFLVKLS